MRLNPPGVGGAEMTTDNSPRMQQIHAWLTTVLDGEYSAPVPASADASFRRYFRIEQAGSSLILMDAPPAHEDCRPFVSIARMLRSWGVNAPAVLAQDLEQGFLLLGDLGSTTYLQVITPDNAAQMYGDALAALVGMQRNSLQDAQAKALPLYDEALLVREMDLFEEWFLGRHLQIELDAAQRDGWQASKALLVQAALEQPRVFVHRDYHSRNLMCCSAEQGGNPGVLDFQDAQWGPLTYDLVSLLRDCYIDWPASRLAQWLGDYAALAGPDLLQGLDGAALRRAFDLMGVQRHLKAVGIFCRLNHRDGKPGYLGDIPRTLGYIRQVAAGYPELAWLAGFLESRAVPAWHSVQD